jgi:hypothetical protein
LNLFQVDSDIRQVIDEHVDFETGELSEAGFALLAALEEDRDTLSLNLAAEFNNHEIEVAGIKEAQKRLKARRDHHQARQNALMKLLNKFVPEGKKLESSEAKIAWRKSTATVVTDVRMLPYDCLVIVPPVADLGQVKQGLADGRIDKNAAHLDHRNTLKVS